MSTKICTKCKIEKDLIEFTKNSKCKGGLNARCRGCKAIYDKLHYSILHPRTGIPANTKYSEEVVKEWYQLYVVELQSPPEIAKRYKCSPITITHRLKKMGVKLRSHSEAQKVLGRTIPQRQREEHSKRMCGEGNPMYGKHHTDETVQKIVKALNEYYGVHVGSWTGRKHSEASIKKMRAKIMSEEACQKISAGNIGKVMSKESRQKISEGCKGLVVGDRNWMFGKTGTKCPHYIDGRSFLPYPPEFTKTLKAKIFKRDKHQCQFPDKDCQGYLCPHHIDYNKMDCRERNLITLCIKHNSYVNFNREYWTEYFQKIIKEK